MKLAGTVTLPPAILVDPPTNGLRLQLIDRTGAVVVERTLASDPYDPIVKRGWTTKITPKGTSYKYQDKSGASDVRSVAFKSKTSLPGVWQVKLGAKAGAYPFPVAAVPAGATMVFDLARGTDRCAEWTFPGQIESHGACAAKPTGAAVTCKGK